MSNSCSIPIINHNEAIRLPQIPPRWRERSCSREQFPRKISDQHLECPQCADDDPSGTDPRFCASPCILSAQAGAADLLRRLLHRLAGRPHRPQVQPDHRLWQADGSLSGQADGLHRADHAGHQRLLPLGGHRDRHHQGSGDDLRLLLHAGQGHCGVCPQLGQAGPVQLHPGAGAVLLASGVHRHELPH